MTRTGCVGTKTTEQPEVRRSRLHWRGGQRGERSRHGGVMSMKPQGKKNEVCNAPAVVRHISGQSCLLFSVRCEFWDLWFWSFYHLWILLFILSLCVQQPCRLNSTSAAVHCQYSGSVLLHLQKNFNRDHSLAHKSYSYAIRRDDGLLQLCFYFFTALATGEISALTLALSTMRS